MPVELREFAEPELEPGSLLLRTLYSEVCGTDVHIWHGRLAGVPFPIIPGHVSVGIADKIRGDVRGVDGARVVEGDRLVFFDVHRTCGRCRACAVNRTPTRCEARRVYGITDSAAEGLFGGWAEAIYLEPGVSMAKLPDSVPVGNLHQRRLRADHGGARDRSRGDHAGRHRCWCKAPARSGSARSRWRVWPAPRRVIAFGAPADRLAAGRARWAPITSSTCCRRLPARATAAGARSLTGGLGVDVAIEAAGSARAVEEALDLIRDGGRYVIAGHYTDAGPSAVNVHQQINKKHLEIRGCWGSEVVALRAGAARARAPSRRDPLARDRRQDLRALGTQSGARRRRGDASSESSCQTQLTPAGLEGRTTRRHTELRIAIAAIGFRLVSAFLAMCAVLAFPLDRRLPDQSTVWGNPSPFWDAFARHDSGWYFDIARKGYDASAAVAGGRSNIAFAPVYPMLMRYVGRLFGRSPGDLYLGGIVVSWLSFALAMVVLYRLAALDLPRRRAERAVLLIGDLSVLLLLRRRVHREHVPAVHPAQFLRVQDPALGRSAASRARSRPRRG